MQLRLYHGSATPYSTEIHPFNGCDFRVFRKNRILKAQNPARICHFVPNESYLTSESHLKCKGRSERPNKSGKPRVAKSTRTRFLRFFAFSSSCKCKKFRFPDLLHRNLIAHVPEGLKTCTNHMVTLYLVFEI